MILRVLLKFLDTTCFYCLMDGIHADFAIFGSIYEQWSQIQIQLEDFHWNSGLSGKCNADSPRVRGGQSASVKDFSQRLCRNGVGSWNVKRTVRSISADSPHGFGYTGIGTSAHWFNCDMALADGPPRSRGRSATGVGQSDKHRLLRCAVSGTKGASRALADGPLGDCGRSARGLRTVRHSGFRAGPGIRRLLCMCSKKVVI